MNSQVVLSTAYLPPIPWLSHVLRAGLVTIDVHEHYIKQTIRNRCTIITANGLMNLVIPVKKFPNHTPAGEIRIDHSTNWQRVHTNALQSAYGKSPFFEFYGEKILPLYEWKAETLVEWNAACLSAIFSILKVNPMMVNSSVYVENAIHDFRDEEILAEEPVLPQYTQVFMERHGFVPGLSVVDLLFCEGPGALKALSG